MTNHPHKTIVFLLMMILIVQLACARTAEISPTPVEVSITFNADQSALQMGECTNLHWDVIGAVLVRLDGKILAKAGEMDICPDQTSTYTLEVNTGSRIDRKSVTISVSDETAMITPSAASAESSGEIPQFAGEDTASRLAFLGGKPCPLGDFTCITLEVPYDHFNPDGRTLEVVFAVLPARGERKGMFVTANGGPGASGLLYADDYTAAFDPSIPENFDIVFFDQRGVGLSGGLQCPEAAATYFRVEWDASDPEGEAVLADSARTFTEECIAEMGNPDYLAYLGTDQAVEDLEYFRSVMGEENLWLYGESYGTQFAQTYAAAYPEYLKGLILDGTVDLTLDGFEFFEQQAQAFNNVLEMTLTACNKDNGCAAELGGDARTIYETLAGRLREEPEQYVFPLPSGGKATRLFTSADLESSAAGYLYSPAQRMIFLRALAAYVRDKDLAPMARLLYDTLVLDPETELAVLDPYFSDAMYYAVECQDYSYPGRNPEERAEAYLRTGDAVDASQPRLASIFYGDFPCAFWPETRQDITRPAALTAEGIPTLVLSATSDPATPYQQSLDIFERLSDGYHVTQKGGPHVIFGWGNNCVDDLVTDFLVDSEMPARQTTCAGNIVDDYFSLAPRSVAGFSNPLEAMISLDDEIYFLPEYYYWDLETPTSVGCPYGGTLVFEPSDLGENLTLSGCSFSEGFAVSGTGSYNFDSGLLTMKVSVSGLADGILTYTRDKDWNHSVIGEYGGESINLSD